MATAAVAQVEFRESPHRTCAWICEQFVGDDPDGGGLALVVPRLQPGAGRIVVFVDCLPPSGDKPHGESWVFLQVESPEISDVVRRLDASRFDRMLTYDEHLLQQHLHAQLFHPFHTYFWVRPPSSATLTVRNHFLPHLTPTNYYCHDGSRCAFAVSMLCGHKTSTSGHRLRQQVWARQEEIRIPRRFFHSQRTQGELPCFAGNLPAPADADKTFLYEDVMFTIAIENQALPHFFTEKLVDCLVTQTLPIYCGCTNLDTWLDPRGYIQVTCIEDLLRAVNALTPQTYAERLPYIQRNHETWCRVPAFRARLAGALAAKVS